MGSRIGINESLLIPAVHQGYIVREALLQIAKLHFAVLHSPGKVSGDGVNLQRNAVSAADGVAVQHKVAGQIQGRRHVILGLGGGEILLIVLQGADILHLEAQFIQHKLEHHHAVGDLGLCADNGKDADVALVRLDRFPELLIVFDEIAVVIRGILRDHVLNVDHHFILHGGVHAGGIGEIADEVRIVAGSDHQVGIGLTRRLGLGQNI